MNKYLIFTDSCIDLPNKLAEELELIVIPMSCTINEHEYHNYLDEREITNKEFYNLLANKNRSVTSQINSEQFEEIFENYLKNGYDILTILFSSALSGTYNSCKIACDDLKEKYPTRNLICIDSLCASMGQGLLLTYAANMRKEGKTIEEVADWCENNKVNVCHLFTVGDLNFLRRGGRLSYAKALLGTILHVKPLLHVNKEGKLVQTGKARGRKSALELIITRM